VYISIVSAVVADRVVLISMLFLDRKMLLEQRVSLGLRMLSMLR
jgi:hypothetical protein